MHDDSDTPKCTLLDTCDFTCTMMSNQHSRVKLLSCTPTPTVATTTITTLRVLFFGSLHSSNLASRATETYHYVHCSHHVILVAYSGRNSAEFRAGRNRVAPEVRSGTFAGISNRLTRFNTDARTVLKLRRILHTRLSYRRLVPAGICRNAPE